MTPHRGCNEAARLTRTIEHHIVVNIMDAKAASAIASAVVSTAEDREWAAKQATASRAAVRALAAFADEAGLPWRGRLRLERIARRLARWEHQRLLRNAAPPSWAVDPTRRQRCAPRSG